MPTFLYYDDVTVCLILTVLVCLFKNNAFMKIVNGISNMLISELETYPYRVETTSSTPIEKKGACLVLLENTCSESFMYIIM